MTIKTNDTLVEDMENVILGLNGWDETLGNQMGVDIAKVFKDRFGAPQEPRGYLSMSGLGTPCDRKLWYKINQTDLAQPLRANTLLKFSYGDMIEELALCIAQQAGHDVVGQQDRMEAHGIKGSRDCVINGMTVDVKSASPYSFKKFKEGGLREQDPFGYISQLSSYVYAAKDDPLVTNKTHGAFLVIDKVNGHICLDVYDLTEEMKTKESEIKNIKEMVKQKVPPARGFEDVPQSKTSPNRKLGMECSYCEFKRVCWPGLKLYTYSHGPTYITKVVKELRVEESDDWV
tara:strand:- start:30653 stop:31519 length:867 start_codon:yes stop_codon:yes gene_type:complete